MAKAFVLAHSGLPNPTKELSAEQFRALLKIASSTLSARPMSEGRQPRGGMGLGVQWDHEGHPTYMNVRGGVVSIFRKGASAPTFVTDAAGLADFLSSCLREEIASLTNPVELKPLSLAR